MHISNIEAKLKEQDIMSIINDFLKIDNLSINEVSLNSNIEIIGTFRTIFKIKFLIKAELTEAKGNIIKLKIKDIKVNRIGIFSFIRNKALKIALKKLALEGINYSDKEIVLEIDKLLKKVPYVSFDITKIDILIGELIAAVENVNISIDALLHSKEETTEEKTDNEIKVQDEKNNQENKTIFVEEKIGGEALVIDNNEQSTEDEEIIDKTEDYYTDFRNTLENKIPEKFADYSDYALLVPEILALVIRLFKDKKVPLKTKIVLGICISYITMPFDLIPDKVPFIGRLDDLGVAVFALTRIIEDVPKEVILSNWEGEKSILEIMENVIIYLNKFTSGGKIDKVYNFIDEIIVI